MPDAGLRGAAERRTRDTCDPQLRPARLHERRREPAVDEEKLAVVADAPGHLLEDRRGEVEPLVQQPAALSEGRAQRLELAFHPARSDRGDDAPAREEIERRQ